MLEILDTAGTVSKIVIVVSKTAFNAVLFLFVPGAIHGDARPVHEERPGLRPRLQHHRAVHLQRPAGPQGSDPQGQGTVIINCAAQNQRRLCPRFGSLTHHLIFKFAADVVEGNGFCRRS